MSIDWVTPFIFAFELGMFVLGSLLVVVIVIFAVLVVYGLIKSAVVALSGSKKKTYPFQETNKTIRKIFPVK